MGKPKFDPPTPSFPYKILRRYNMLSTPKKYYVDTGEGMPTLTPRGIRKSALNAHISDRVNDAAWPYIRRLLLTKRMCKSRFSAERLERLDRMIEAANGTMYSKLANCVIDLKKQDNKEVKKKKGWTESEWKKHMDYIGQIAGPKRDFRPPPLTDDYARATLQRLYVSMGDGITYHQRGPRKPLEALLPRLNEMSQRPTFKIYKRLSQESSYRDPIKVPPNALKYIITDRVKRLATPRVIPVHD